MRLLPVLAAAALLRGQSLGDPDRLLEKARARFQAMARELEKYVCVETVDRNYYRRVEPQRPAACSQAR